MKFLLSLVISMMFLSVAHADEARLISVSGTAEKSVKPDLLAFSLEIWSKTAAAQRTQALAADETKRIMKILENYKINETDIQTESFQFNPEYVWDQGGNQNRLSGYRSTQVLRVTLRKTDQAGRLIDALTVAEKGGTSKSEFGTNIRSIQWDSSQRSQTEAQVLEMAVRAARVKADAMAKAGGVKIKRVHRLSHRSQFDPGPQPIAKMRMAMAAEAAPTELAEGEIKIQVSVDADYEMQ